VASRRCVLHVLDFCILVTSVAPAGEYSLTDKVIEVEFGGVKKVCTPCQSINQFAFLVLRTHQGSQQTTTGKTTCDGLLPSLCFTGRCQRRDNNSVVILQCSHKLRA